MQKQFKVGDKIIIARNGRMINVPIGTVLTVERVYHDSVSTYERFSYRGMDVNSIWNEQIELLHESRKTHMPEWF